jgi:hypothetical protein
MTGEVMVCTLRLGAGLRRSFERSTAPVEGCWAEVNGCDVPHSFASFTGNNALLTEFMPRSNGDRARLILTLTVGKRTSPQLAKSNLQGKMLAALRRCGA